MFDANAKVGHWPYRPVKDLDAQLGVMDTLEIGRAVVSSLDAVFYLNPQEGNENLLRATEAHRDRLLCFAVLRPNIAGWEDDLETCLRAYEMKGVVLYPNYHRFSLLDARLAPLMEQAAASGFPVCVQMGLEDVRRQFDRAIVENVPLDDLMAFVAAYPQTRVVGLGLKFGELEQMPAPLPQNFWFDTSNYEQMGDLEHAVPKFGADRMLFGTNTPVYNMHANVMKLNWADIPDTARQAIAAENLERMLGLR